jgi:transposase
MGRPYSMDLRQRVVDAIGAGMSCREAAGHFDIGISTAIRWARRQSQTGSPAALPMGTTHPFSLAGEADWLRRRMAQKPDLTLRALLAELAERGVKVSYYAVWHFVHHAGLSFKKKPARQRARAARRGAPARAMEVLPT